jgi:hypothetical protein
MTDKTTEVMTNANLLQTENAFLRAVTESYALEQLLLAFAKADVERRDHTLSVAWEDVELAFELAREAMPGRYLEIVRELNEDDND